MKGLRRNCKYYAYCKWENSGLDDVWKFTCPTERKNTECIKYGEWDRLEKYGDLPEKPEQLKRTDEDQAYFSEE